MPSSVKMRTLLEMGVHFGHRVKRWNPKMDEFIFTSRNGIHIIDLQQTLANLNEYFDMVRDIVADGGTIMFVGTKRQAQESIEIEANRCGMAYVNQRWLGGTLTNWRTIRSRIDTLKKLEADREAGVFDLLTKKEALMNERQIKKLQLRLGGVREMKRVPNILVVVDTEREETAVKEANILGIPVLGIVDTNGNPDVVDYIIPGNDDAMRSIRLLVSAMADAVIEGKAIRGGGDVDGKAAIIATIPDIEDNVPNEDLLGESTLQKLRENQLDFDDGEDETKAEVAETTEEVAETTEEVVETTEEVVETTEEVAEAAKED
jgi:small subunit ribosomal protein S2